jgi:hypothetical protein
MNAEEIVQLKDELEQEANLDITPDRIIEQIKTFESGIPFIKLVKASKIGDGIKLIPENKQQRYIDLFQTALDGGRVMKFVPASGAATRMFKKLQAVLLDKKKVTIEGLKNKKENEIADAVLEFLKNIDRFAFYDELVKNLNSAGINIEDLLKSGDVTDIIKYTLEPIGLNYANLPKGCIKFHSFHDGARTAFEEHLVEAIHYSAGNDKITKIHFTISPEHKQIVKEMIDSIKKKYITQGWQFDVSYSFQSPTTNTIAATTDNKPFRDDKGQLVFRPAGHGALLKNLNELNGDIILIKNIDNVVPDHLRGETYKYKKFLGGYLVELQNEIFSFLYELEKGTTSENLIEDIKRFIISELELELKTDFYTLDINEKREYLFEFINRPIRVCGIVKKEGHAGGGPFWVKDEQGNISKQVVETTQIDLNDLEQKKIFEDASHFSPVDFACGVKDYKGNNFNLEEYSNPNTGLITQKSKDGKELKALELPGLWNGGMYNWLTVFIEVPIITFNPVKEVNDLLKPEHQPAIN